jgi:GntR family histidine utilization transcriptional repressor
MAICDLFGPTTSETYFSSVIHLENDQPIQLELRHVNPRYAPDYLAIDLTKTTANEYLMSVCPAHRVSHQIEAVQATDYLKSQLQLTTHEPCLKVTRDTWYQGYLVSHAELYHPGSRYVLGTLFSLTNPEEAVHE